MMNKKEKPWDSFVLFAPEKMMEQDTEDYFFYGSDEYITLSKDKLNDKPPEIVKCVVTRREGVYPIRSRCTMICSLTCQSISPACWTRLMA